MDRNPLFVRQRFRNLCPQLPDTGFFYLETANGNSDIAVVADPRGEEDTVYLTSRQFITKNAHILPISELKQWYQRWEMEMWLGKVIYLSFVSNSRRNDDDCWFLLNIDSNDPYEYAHIPSGYEDVFEGEGVSRWVLLKNDYRVWPVLVTNNQFTEGWEQFWNDNNLQAGYTIICACDREWIFDVIILDDDLETIEDTSFGDKLELLTYHLRPDGRDTACLPFDIINRGYVVQFAYFYESSHHCVQMFEHHLSTWMPSFNTQKLQFRMFENTWEVNIVSQRLHRPSFNRFLSFVNLQARECMFVTVNDAWEVWIIVFKRSGAEKSYH